MEPFEPTKNYESIYTQQLENMLDRGKERLENWYSMKQITENYEKNYEKVLKWDEVINEFTPLVTEIPEKTDFNLMAYGNLWLIRDLMIKDSKVQQEVKATIFNNIKGPAYRLVTINYPRDLLGIHRIKEITTNINNLEWVDSIDTYQYEYYTESGNHPHCHMLIILKENMPKSKIIDKIFAVKDIKKLIDRKTAIDVADNMGRTMQNHRDYILGHKKDSKMENVEKDKLWRIENNLDS